MRRRVYGDYRQPRAAVNVRVAPGRATGRRDHRRVHREGGEDIIRPCSLSHGRHYLYLEGAAAAAAAVECYYLVVETAAPAEKYVKRRVSALRLLGPRARLLPSHCGYSALVIE